MTVSSPEFSDGDDIPRRYTCEGDDISPPLDVVGVPPGTAELALLVEDPDAPSGTFVHWVAWGIDPAAGGLAEAQIAPGTGTNSFRALGYRGPCPPPGPPHRYMFTFLALSERLDLPPGATADDLRSAAEGLVLDDGTLTGLYARQS